MGPLKVEDSMVRSYYPVRTPTKPAEESLTRQIELARASSILAAAMKAADDRHSTPLVRKMTQESSKRTWKDARSATSPLRIRSLRSRDSPDAKRWCKSSIAYSEDQEERTRHVLNLDGEVDEAALAEAVRTLVASAWDGSPCTGLLEFTNNGNVDVSLFAECQRTKTPTELNASAREVLKLGPKARPEVKRMPEASEDLKAHSVRAKVNHSVVRLHHLDQDMHWIAAQMLMKDGEQQRTERIPGSQRTACRRTAPTGQLHEVVQATADSS